MVLLARKRGRVKSVGVRPVKRRNNSLVDLMLVSNPQLLSVVRGAIERLSEIFGFSPAECRSVTRAVDEALANVIRHAYGNRPDRIIQVRCGRVYHQAAGKRREGLEILLLDHGVAFDHKKLKERCLDEVKPGGLGLHFIRDSVDIMEHSRVRGTNQLRLVKFANPRAAATH